MSNDGRFTPRNFLLSGPRRARVLAAVGVVALLAGACGSTRSPSAGSNGTTASTAGSTGTTNANANVPGVTATTITLGATEPLTGAAAVAGQGLTAGIRLATDYLNAHGGIAGRKVNFTVLDDGYIQSREIANIRQLVSANNVYALVDPAGSQGIAGTWDFIKQSGTIMWGPISPSDPKLPSVYLLTAPRQAEDEAAIDYFAAQGITKLALIGEDDDLGTSLSAAAKVQVPKHPGMSVVASETVEPTSTDVSPAVQAVKNANAQAVIVATGNARVTLVLKGLANLGVHIPVYADQGAANTGTQGAVGPAGAAADGFLGGLQTALPTISNPTVDAWKAAAQSYTGPGGSTQALSAFSLQTYLQALAFAQVMSKLGNDLSYQHFESVADSLQSNPINIAGMPPIACGPLPDGHTCATASAIAKYDASSKSWTVVQDFTTPK